MSDGEMTPAQKAADPEVQPEEKKRTFPTALGILAVVILLVWIATFFIPSGQYQLDENGEPIPGSFQEVDSPLDFGERVADLLLSPINGLYGLLDAETGQVGPFNSGALFGSAQVFLFILAIGGFMTVVFATGSLDRGIALLAHRFKANGAVLIIALSLLFGLLGSVMTWSDESLGFYALMIPLMLALGFDRLVTVAVVTVAPFVGAIGSTVTPFRIGIGSDAAGVSIGDGIGLRIVLFVLTMAALIVFTLRYAKRVRTDPSRSMIGIDSEDAEVASEADSDELEPLTGRQKIVLVLTAGTFVVLTFSIIPWGSILNNTAVDPISHETLVNPYSWELGWWLPELTALFIVMAIVVGVVGRLGEAGTGGHHAARLELPAAARAHVSDDGEAYRALD